ncbi:MAG: hypothetical protein VB045_04475, partial [Synergistaceae bacterium]|nr:hypothetical protein [Synergistaceae bacterium]
MRAIVQAIPDIVKGVIENLWSDCDKVIPKWDRNTVIPGRTESAGKNFPQDVDVLPFTGYN